MVFLTRLLCLTAVSQLLIVGAVWGEVAKATLLVRRDHLRCVIDNVERYKTSKNNPVIIYLTICPALTLTVDEIRKATQNALPELSAKQTQGNLGAKGPEAVIILTKDELGCIIRYRHLLDGEGGQNVELPQHICADSDLIGRKP